MMSEMVCNAKQRRRNIMKDVSVTHGENPSLEPVFGKIRVIGWFLGIFRITGCFLAIFVILVVLKKFNSILV